MVTWRAEKSGYGMGNVHCKVERKTEGGEKGILEMSLVEEEVGVELEREVLAGLEEEEEEEVAGLEVEE